MADEGTVANCQCQGESWRWNRTLRCRRDGLQGTHGTNGSAEADTTHIGADQRRTTQPESDYARSGGFRSPQSWRRDVHYRYHPHEYVPRSENHGDTG